MNFKAEPALAKAIAAMQDLNRATWRLNFWSEFVREPRVAEFLRLHETDWRFALWGGGRRHIQIASEADRYRTEVLERFADACRAARTRLAELDHRGPITSVRRSA